MEAWAAGMSDTADLDPVAPLIAARALLSLGLAVREQGDITRFRNRSGGRHSRLWRMARRIVTPLALALHLRGLAAADQHRFEDSEAAYARAESLWERIGDRRNASTTPA